MRAGVTDPFASADPICPMGVRFVRRRVAAEPPHRLNVQTEGAPGQDPANRNHIINTTGEALLSKNVAVFVDVANIYYSARGQEVDVDYVALLKAATKGRDLIRAYAYSGLDPENENQRKFIDFLGKNGYKVVHKDIRKFGDGRMKANLDIELVVDLFRLADRMDIAVIVSGDGDFAPAIRALQDGGVRCEVYSFRPNTSSDLMAVADEFVDMMKIIGIGRGKDADKADKIMSAPPMPAKEVVPEFGFREAPAAVAAAALAALREGKEARPASRGRGRSRTRPEASDAAPVVVAPDTTAAAAPEGSGGTPTDGAVGEAPRRRRRRGGRGRGRGRAREEDAVTETAAPSSGEIGWVELDDISQIGDLESLEQSREYTFEEADAATLAELGLLPEVIEVAPAPAARPRRSAARPSAKVEPTEAPAEAPVKPRRSRSSRAAPTEASVPGDESAPKPQRARRTAAAKAADVGSMPSATETAKPRRARPARTKADVATTTPAEGEPEGIWQRFRSGRTTKS